MRLSSIAIATICLAAITPLVSAEPSPTNVAAKEEATRELLELSLGLGFSAAAKEERPERAREMMNQIAFSYYLLCVGKKAVIPPSKEIESGFAFQRSKLLADSELLDDPLNVAASAGGLASKTDRQMSGKNYGLKSIEDYHALVGEFHTWLKGLKFEPRKMDAIKIEPR